MLKSLIDFAIERRVTIVMFTVAIALFGFVSLSRLKLNLLPDLSYPTITIRTELPGAAPLEVETLISRPVEETVSIIRNVREVRSVSRAGQSDVTLEFVWGTDMDIAGIDVREKLDLLQLPLEAKRPLLLRFDPSSEPVLRLALLDEAAVAGSADSIERLKSLRRFAEDRLKPDLEAVEGSAAVKVSGGYEDEVQVFVDQEKLAPLGLSIDVVTPSHPRGERQPVGRPARTGHAAVPGPHAERVRQRRGDGERHHRAPRTASRCTCATSRASRAATRTARRSRASTARNRSRSPSTRKATPTPSPLADGVRAAHQGAGEEPAGQHEADPRCTTSRRSSPPPSARSRPRR